LTHFASTEATLSVTKRQWRRRLVRFKFKFKKHDSSNAPKMPKKTISKQNKFVKNRNQKSIFILMFSKKEAKLRQNKFNFDKFNF